jgi:hypothetical protein
MHGWERPLPAPPGSQRAEGVAGWEGLAAARVKLGGHQERGLGKLARGPGNQRAVGYGERPFPKRRPELPGPAWLYGHLDRPPPVRQIGRTWCLPSDADREQRPAVHVAPSAGQMLAATARLLPAADRGRYLEECRAELWEIASAGAGRRQQIRYAVHVLIRVAPLRAAVLAPRRRNATP